MPTDPTPTDRAAESESDCECDATGPDTDRVAALERRVSELEAELEAVRGLLDGVAAVDETVERRASIALAKAEALEERFTPEEAGLVRERLPDATDDEQRELGSDRRAQHGIDRDDAEPETGERRRTDSEGRGDRNREQHADTADPIGGLDSSSDPAVGDDMACFDTPDTTETGPSGTGAISSVGSEGPDGKNAAGTEDRPLSARLRDAFR